MKAQSAQVFFHSWPQYPGGAGADSPRLRYEGHTPPEKPMRPIAAILTAALLAAPALPAAAQSHRAGQFDYYVVALSWSPSWCRGTGDSAGRGNATRAARSISCCTGCGRNTKKGWPSNCRTNERDPSRRESQAMSDIIWDRTGWPGISGRSTGAAPARRRRPIWTCRATRSTPSPCPITLSIWTATSRSRRR